MRCMCELTVTMRERSVVTMRSSSRPVRAKWPRWLVAICSSKPSAVWRYGVPMTPALLTRRSSRAWLARNGRRRVAHRDQVGQVEGEQLERAAVELALELVPGPARLLLVRGRP